MFVKVTKPDRILFIGFFTANTLYIFWISYDNLTVVFQNIKYRVPILTRRLHTDMFARYRDLSHFRRRCKSSVKVENCLVWYSVTPDLFVVPTVATTNFLWTSIPQQIGCTILSINTSP